MLNNLDTTKYGDYIFSLELMVTIKFDLRRGALAGLEWENIDFENNIVRIRNNLIYLNISVEFNTLKTLERQIVIYVSDEILEKLKKHKEVQDSNKTLYTESYESNMFNNRVCNFIFTLENGKYVHPNYFTLKFSRLSKESGINKKVRFHDLRHTNATLLLEQEIDFKIIQTRLGHSDISTTLNIYFMSQWRFRKLLEKNINFIFSKTQNSRRNKSCI